MLFPSTMVSMGAFVVNDMKNSDSGFMGSNLFFKGHQTLKEQLASMREKDVIEAMRKIVEMMAKGQDVSDLFPSVVKNVVSKSTEVKKLVYMYLVRYAEEQQDLALLSISTFQKGLKDANQLIRASALRVLSSIRVEMIVPIMMLAIRDAVSDLSPYVRKTAAHAIPKLYSLDPEQKEALIDVVEKLLQDKTTLVAGSAVMAFEQLCPERIDLVHKNFRRHCAMVADIDEWGQCAVINMLTRYARTQFINPNAKEEVEEEKDEKSSGSESDSSGEELAGFGSSISAIDPDLRLLLQACRPLLQSRNSAVVMQVAQLFYHCAPEAEIVHVVKALIRLLKSRREVQYVVLTNITTMSAKYRNLFETHLRSFFVNASDPTNVRLLKLEILTNIASEGTISILLREFQTYVYSTDKEFAAATVHAIGRCAASISEVTDVCLHGLMNLISTKDDTVVGESVIVIKKLLQMHNSDKSSIIKRMTKLLTTVTVPLARASILWLVGEYVEKVPKLAPDVLRRMAKSFPQEEDIVKLQILNLAAKAWIVNNKKITLLVPYILAQAKYDLNYDIRDRERFIRRVLCPNSGAPSPLEKYAKKFFMTAKPPPNLRSTFKNRDEYQLGSLSHMINSSVQGYQALPNHPIIAPDASVRDVVVEQTWHNSADNNRDVQAAGAPTFYSSEGETEESSSEEDGSEEEESSEGDSGSEEESEEEEEGSSSEEEEGETSEEESSTSEEEQPVKPVKVKKSKHTTDTLLDFDAPLAPPPTQEAHQSTLDELLGGLDLTNTQPNYEIDITRPVYELLHRMTAGGLSVDYSFPRASSVDKGAVLIQLTFTNTSAQPVGDIKIVEPVLKDGMTLTEFDPIETLLVGETETKNLSINFNDTLQPAKFTICTSTGKYPCSIQPPIGEMICPFVMDEPDFSYKQGKLSGMHENCGEVDVGNRELGELSQRISEKASMSLCFTSQPSTLLFSAKTTAQEQFMLLTVAVSGSKAKITVNSEAVVLGSMLLKDISAALKI